MRDMSGPYQHASSRPSTVSAASHQESAGSVQIQDANESQVSHPIPPFNPTIPAEVLLTIFTDDLSDVIIQGGSSAERATQHATLAARQRAGHAVRRELDRLAVEFYNWQLAHARVLDAGQIAQVRAFGNGWRDAIRLYLERRARYEGLPGYEVWRANS